MSGECEKCGEHAVECRCRPTVTLYEPRAGGDTVAAWQFQGEDRPDWPGWVSRHLHTAVHYPENGPRPGMWPAAFISISVSDAVPLPDRSIVYPGQWIVCEHSDGPRPDGALSVLDAMAFHSRYRPYVEAPAMTLDDLHQAVAGAALSAAITIRKARRDAMRIVDEVTMSRRTSHLPHYLVAVIRKEAEATIERAVK